MHKRGKSVICSFEIFLLILSSFAISFILSDSLVVAQEGVISLDKPATTQIPTESTGNVLTAVEEEYAKTAAEVVGGARPEIAASEETFKSKIGITDLEISGFGTSGNFFAAHLLEGVVWGGVLALGIKFLGPLVGLSEEQSNAAALAAFGGITTGKALYGLIGPKGYFSTFTGSPGLVSFGVGAIVAVVIFVALYKTEKKKLVNFQCLPFEPPLGGASCEECNKDPFRPCSEYRCRALGQACQIVNPGTAEERCAWVNPKDVTSPTIQAWKDALKPSDLSYIPDATIRPPNRGVKIVKGQNCLQAFTPLEFGITTNEPAQCKLDYKLTNTMDEMQFFMGGSNYYRYNHTQKMKLPGPDTSQEGELAPELSNDGTFSLYSRCRDANGNENVDAFVFNFCVDQSPDTTPPVIEGTSILSKSPTRFGADTVPLDVYVNEPAECKWSRTSKSYEDMENSMSCATETFQINANLNYVCKTNLTGIKNQEDNKFYFRCKDQPTKQDKERNVMTQSYEFILRGSQPLNIISVGPNATIFGSTDTVPVDLTVKTDDGAEEGKAICYFSSTGEKDSYIGMFETNSFEHKQTLDLVSGNYEYFFRCIDAGSNTAEDKTSFSVLIDKEIPLITRAYKEEGLKIVTNEDAQCVYSQTSCNYNFEEGLPLIYSNPSIKTNHFAEWKSGAVYYIKCSDFYNNMPSPNECNIVVNTIELTNK